MHLQTKCYYMKILGAAAAIFIGVHQYIIDYMNLLQANCD